ncbi:2-amino-4-hydroxy-6-hydroxymethyldihydropteridine diphosphokinase [Kushneria sp. Sum13]|uniref:2-amino-4-hydroxy-6- hydroxymethyldihydropteridine diphosphokinase n=1 Tax=Kushneria sp. Sum13 TaxID=3459196 RepID=UPI0040457277
MSFVLFSLGSNAHRHRRIDAALSALHGAFGELLISRVFESHPVGFDSPCNFYNLVVGASCPWSVARLNQWCKQVERDNGRDHSAPKFSSRALDIDILCVDDLTGCVDGVTLPREEITYNAFVLRPLAESFGEYRHPLTGTAYRALWQAFDADSQGLWPVSFEWQGKRISAPEPIEAVTLAPARIR